MEQNGGPTNDYGQNSDNNPQTSGPQFELVETGGWGKRLRGWLNKYGSSVILPIVALVILASGIYLYATQKKQEASMLLDGNEPSATVIATEDESLDGINIAEETGNLDVQIIDNITTDTTVPDESEKKVKEIIPEKRKTQAGDVRIMKAQQGEGITHLARRALKDYLGNNKKTKSLDLTKEHKIYVEDYIKDKIGSKMLGIGEEIEISENLIEEAINSSTKLTDSQLKAIEKFSTLVESEI